MAEVQKHAASRMDRFGTIASMACLVHCIATPLLLSIFAVAAPFVPSEQRIHRFLAVPVCLIGIWAMRSGFSRHQRLKPTLLMVFGLSLIVAGAVWGNSLPSHWMEVAVTMSGSALMITAHRMNHRFCTQCECHGHSHSHEHAPAAEENAVPVQDLAGSRG